MYLAWVTLFAILGAKLNIFVWLLFSNGVSGLRLVQGDTNWFVIFSIFLVGSVGGSLLSQPVGQLFNRQVRRHRRRRIRDVPV